MSARRIHVRVSPFGEITVEADGFQGKGCEAATKAIEEAPGNSHFPAPREREKILNCLTLLWSFDSPIEHGVFPTVTIKSPHWVGWLLKKWCVRAMRSKLAGLVRSQVHPQVLQKSFDFWTGGIPFRTR